jgi:hypothetical protein
MPSISGQHLSSSSEHRLRRQTENGIAPRCLSACDRLRGCAVCAAEVGGLLWNQVSRYESRSLAAGRIEGVAASGALAGGSLLWRAAS